MHKNKIDQKRKGIWAGVLLGASMLCMSSLGQAAPLNLVLKDAPDILSTSITSSYDANAETFLADGFASQLFTGTNTYTIMDVGLDDAIFDLSASIDNFGNLVGGTLTITGEIDDLMFNTGILLTGDLTAVGFAGGLPDDTIEFLFAVTGGDASMMYGSVGGVILANTRFAGTWADDFVSRPDQVQADTGVPVSAPTTILMLGIALGGLARSARRKQK